MKVLLLLIKFKDIIILPLSLIKYRGVTLLSLIKKIFYYIFKWLLILVVIISILEVLFFLYLLWLART